MYITSQQLYGYKKKKNQSSIQVESLLTLQRQYFSRINIKIFNLLYFQLRRKIWYLIVNKQFLYDNSTIKLIILCHPIFPLKRFFLIFCLIKSSGQLVNFFKYLEIKHQCRFIKLIYQIPDPQNKVNFILNLEVLFLKQCDSLLCFKDLFCIQIEQQSCRLRLVFPIDGAFQTCLTVLAAQSEQSEQFLSNLIFVKINMNFPQELQQEIDQNIPDELRQEIKGHNKVFNGIIKKNAPFYKNFLNCILAILLLPFILMYLAFQFIIESKRQIRQLFKKFLFNCGRLRNKIFDAIIFITFQYEKLKIRYLNMVFKIILMFQICVLLVNPFQEFTRLLDLVLDQYLYYQSLLQLIIYHKYLNIKHRFVMLYLFIYNNQVESQIINWIHITYIPSTWDNLQIEYIKNYADKQFKAKCIQMLSKIYNRVVVFAQNKLQYARRLIVGKVIKTCSQLFNVSTKVILLTLFISLYLIKKIFLTPYMQLDKTLDNCLDAYMLKVTIIQMFFEQYINNIINTQQLRFQYVLNCLQQLQNYLISKKQAVIDFIKSKLQRIRLSLIQFLRNTYKMIIKVLPKLILIAVFPIYLLFQIQLFNQSVIDLILDSLLINYEKFILLLDKSIFKVTYIIYNYMREKLIILQRFLRKRQGLIKKKIFKLLSTIYNFVKSIVTNFIIKFKIFYENYMDQIIRDTLRVLKQFGVKLGISVKELVSQITKILVTLSLQIKQQVTTVLSLLINQIRQYVETLKPLIKSFILETKDSIIQILKNIKSMIRK
ncbi:hypothetical protein pb186bvf_001891 [Paramecium bursaria]